MKKLRKISKEYYVRQVLSCWLVFYMLFCFGIPARAVTTPDVDDAGGATVNQSGDLTDVLVNQQETLMQWSNFDTTSAETVQFRDGELVGTMVFSKITGGRTEFHGKLTGDEGMALYFQNQAGFLFGSTSTVNVTELGVTSLNIDPEDFFNGLSHTLTDGLNAGDITNEGTINAVRAALIGRNVINKGYILAEESVIMAAGDTVTISENGGVIGVVVSMGAGVPSDFVVRNEDGDGIEVKADEGIAQIVLAAGDIWSAACIEAYADGGSDAVATVDIDAAGDVTIVNSDIDAVAEGDGLGGFDALAAINIEAGGKVEVISDDSATTSIEARAYNGINNSATVSIMAEGDAGILGPDRVEIYAEAYGDEFDSTLNEAAVGIKGDNVTIIADDTGFTNQPVEIIAYAHDGEENRATVDIEATEGNVDITASDKDTVNPVLIEARAKDGMQNNYADVMIKAAENITMLAEDNGAKIKADALGGVTNTATIDIDAGGDVQVIAENGNNAAIEADAHDGVTNTATIDVDAEGDVKVTATDEDSEAAIEAETWHGENSNTSTVDITAGGNVEVTATNTDTDTDTDTVAQIRAEAQEGQNNTADVQIDADGYVKVLADASLDNWAAAKIEAEAHDGQNNTANVTVDAIGDVDVIANHGAAEIRAAADDGENNTATVKVVTDSDVTVKADSTTGKTSTAKIETEAEDGINNTAATVIDALGDVLVMGTAGGSADAEIIAKAQNIEDDDIYVSDGDVLEGLVNTASVDITARNVEVRGEDDGHARIEADARNEIEIGGDVEVAVTIKDVKNDADVKITVTADEEDEGGDVIVISKNGGEADIDAEAWNDVDAYNCYDVALTIEGPVENEADVTIDAEDDVKVMAFGGDSDADIDAEARNELDDNYGDYVDLTELGPITNTAGVDITAGDDVKVIGKDGGEADIEAEAKNRSDVFPDSVPESKNNFANISIKTGGDVKVLGIHGDAEIKALAEFATNNTATIDIDAVGGDVIVKDIGSEGENTAKIEARAELALISNTADVQITATAVEVIEEVEPDVFESYIEGGNVEVIAKDGGHAEITAYAAWAYGSENTANVDIDAVGGDVLVHGVGGFYGCGFTPSQASISAEAEGAYGDDETSGKNTANVTITATATTSECVEVLEEEGVTLTYVDVEGGDVKVIGVEGGKADITATAKDAEGFVEIGDDELPVSGPSNVANVRIKAVGAEGIDEFKLVTPAVYEEDELIEPAVYEAITSIEGGDVEVKALGWGSGPDSEASITAETMEGFSNDSDILICAENVEVVGGTECKPRGDAEILALAKDGHFNDAYLGINARGDLSVLAWRGEAKIESVTKNGFSNNAYTHICADDVLVEALRNSKAKIEAKAEHCEFNTAEIDLVSRGDVKVIARNDSEAKIEAKAEDAYSENNARVGIWADGDVIVRGRLNGAKAKIAAEADNECEGTDNDAEVTVVAGGDIRVTAAVDGKAEIVAKAKYGSNLNNAYVGLWTDGAVVVAGYDDGQAKIKAEAKYGIDNIAKVAVCAEDDVVVASGFDPKDSIPKMGTGGSATIKAEAEADQQEVWVYNEDTQQDELIKTSADAEVKVVSHGGGVAVIDITGERQEPTAKIEAEAHGAYSNDAYVGVAAGSDLAEFPGHDVLVLVK